MKILIADDNDEYRFLVEKTLEGLGHECLTASDGAEAMTILGTTIPDLILLDINMPNMDGITVLKNVRSSKKFESVPVIMISSLSENDVVLECLEKGADDYVTKPFKKAVLKARVTNNLNRRLYYKREKELLEKTLVGSISILTEILETLDPKIFTKISRLKKHVEAISAQLNYPEDIWVMNMATHFLLIGCIYLPRNFVIKAITGKMLLDEERKIFDQHTEHGYKILSKIPRMEKVSEIIRYFNKNYDGSGPPNFALMRGLEIPIGSRILRAAWEYDVLYMRHENPENTASDIRGLEGKLDPDIIPIIENKFYTEKTGDIEDVMASEIVVGMIFLEDVYTKKKVKIAGKWQEVTDSLFERITSIQNLFGLREPIKVIKPLAQKNLKK